MIENFEGYSPTPAPDPVGIPTVCFGQTAVDGVLPSFATRGQCEAMLRRSLDRGYEPAVRALFGSRGRLVGLFNQHRFDALVSFAYNLGTGALGSLVRSRDLRATARSMLGYDHAGGAVLVGLAIRRRAESALFLRPLGRFEGYLPAEAHLILAYDRLVGHPSQAAHDRRLRLQAAMLTAARQVARLARTQHDWLSFRRLDRYQALLRRIPNKENH